MDIDRYVCYKCQRVEQFNSRRKTHPCPICSHEMMYMWSNTVVGSRLYNGHFSYYEKELIIPEGTKDMEWGAFKASRYLEKIVFSATLESISGCCFEGCESLKEVAIPKSVKTIGYNAFGNCSSLKEVVLSEGVEEIGECAFFECKNINHISFPSSLKKIGKRAFDNDEQHPTFKVIALPESILEIGEDAFGINYNKSQLYFLVIQNSFAEKYVKKHGLKYQNFDNKEGFASKDYVYNGTLFFSNTTSKSVKIKRGVTTIAKHAFTGHTEIEEVVLPDMLTDIQSYAFEGCTSIKKLKFNNGIKRICAKAFYDIDVRYAELPSSVEELAPDSFNENCVVSIGGEMPGYAGKTLEIASEQEKINCNKERLEGLKQKVSDLEIQIETHKKSLPAEFDNISDYQKKRDEILTIIKQNNLEKKVKFEALAGRISQIKQEEKRLSKDRSKCFILALSRKRELDAAITGCKEKEKLIQDEMQQLDKDYSTKTNQLNIELKLVDDSLKKLEEAKNDWDKRGQQLKYSLAEINLRIEKSSQDIKVEENTLAEKRKLLAISHEQWISKFNNAKESVKIDGLVYEKAQLISKLNIPKMKTVLLKSNGNDALVDEAQINEAYHRVIENQIERQNAILYNDFLEGHTAEVVRIKKINHLLKKLPEDGIAHLKKKDIPDLLSEYLPERFAKLNAYFRNNAFWKNLKSAAKEFACPQKAKLNFHDAFFTGSDYLSFTQNSKYLLVFPYCAIVYEADQPMKILTYDKLKSKVNYSDREEIIDKVPALGELISQKYKHLNADGSPSKRYKDNPIIKTIRYTSITFTYRQSTIISFPVKLYNTAVGFIEEYNSFIADLCSGIRKGIYASVTASKELTAIEEEILILSQMEKEKKLSRIREAKEEEKRIQEERLAAKAAAEEKRREIIKRQKEINEERKQQAKEKEEKLKRIARMFDDDYTCNDSEVENAKANDMEINNYPKLPVEVVGKRLISNTVFKTTLITVGNFDSTLTAYFVDEQGLAISNRKRVEGDPLCENITLGFILNSGTDYTSMKKCFLQFEEQEKVIGSLDFIMNIAFSSDFF